MDAKKTANITFIGIGGMKCGTTWLSECLRYHPEIFMSIPKEIHFFGSKTNWYKGVEWYMEHFRGSEGYKAVGEFSTSYLQNTTSAQQIGNTLGQVKILAMFRDPVERFISHYKQLIRAGTFERGRLKIDTFRKATSLYPQLIGHGNYYRNLQRFIEIFGTRNVYIIIKEEVDKNPKVELEKVYSFLEVDPQYAPPILNKQVSPGIIPRFSSLETLRIRLFHALNAQAPWLIVYSRKLRLPEIYRKLNSDKRANQFKIEGEVIEEPFSCYRDEILNVEHFLGRKLDAWERI